jgi:Zn-dependent M28 family amino/carboxypeptidase
VFLSKATFHPFTSSEAISYTGLALIVTGMVIRFLAIRALGKFFTVDLTFQKEQSLIKEGLYKHIRHPAYAGSLLSFLGLGLALNNWLSTLIVFIPVFLSMLYRIRLEEKMLLEKTGAEKAYPENILIRITHLKEVIMKPFSYLLFVFIIPLILTGCNPDKKQSLTQRADRISRTEMQAVAEFLGDDLLEGRAPGTRGGDLAEIYIKSLYKYLDLAPGVDGAYMQPFGLKGFSTQDLSISSGENRLKYISDVVGAFPVEEKDVEFEGDAVFVGFGIEAENWDWDDYKDTDVKDKIVITRVNDPGSIDPEIFEGNTLTYYGRWTYHIEEAARRGAAGILLIHTDASAGYDWNVVVNSWTGEELYIQSELDNNLKFSGWIREESLKKLLGEEGPSLEELYQQSESRDFRPVDLGIKLKIEGKNSFRNSTCRNVVAEIPGKSEKRIVLSAHIDHLGLAPGREGDNIYNGAIDNGTAVAAMMVTARILKEFDTELHYTITILACQAEESGLLGSKYYVENTDRENIVANINFESTPVWAEARSIMGIGARFSGFEDLIRNLAEENGLVYSYFSRSNQGLFYRSDQFSFARYGIPAVWISAGEDEVTGETHYTEFWSTDYHTVNDEFDESWELGGMRQTIKYALLLIDRLNRTQSPPLWKNDLSFPMEK